MGQRYHIYDSNSSYCYSYKLTQKFYPGCPGYKDQPTENDRIHCVVFVISATTLGVMDEKVKGKLREIRAEADGRCKI